MNISDLQYIESVDASEVQGAGKYKDYFKKYKNKYGGIKAGAGAVAGAGAAAEGDATFALTETEAVADANAGLSLSTSKSVAFAANKYDKH